MEILRESGTRMLFASEIWDSFEIDCYTGYFPLPWWQYSFWRVEKKWEFMNQYTAENYNAWLVK